MQSPELQFFDDCIVRLFFFIASKTLANDAVFFFVAVFVFELGPRTRIVGAATSSMKSNSRFLFALKTHKHYKNL